ncbi:U3 small nucleolar RNA-associated protein 14 homolog A [Lampris incognitus]|uniref:U3 small nucleolar RNA-associated protein 14 homolog A n=1 Tax=Lampris incognitus TaxID=2546036 RepID=UPI0024B4B2F9|nr:U3 small nucleolar RNA-associated protein 14 homolog A [Lampris incognitus]
MAKTSKKTGRKSRKKTEQVIDKTTAVKPSMDYDDDDDEAVPHGGDDNIEDEESEDERKHIKLLEAISSLGGKRKKKLAERSEATVQMSEFMVNAEGEGDKINLSDLIVTTEKTPAISVKTKKQLKNLQHSKRTVDCPLSKQQTERIQRDVAFQQAATQVSRWQGIVRQNQKAEQLVFPLNREPSGPKPIERVVAGWKARTPLEEEIFSLLSINKQPINDPVLTPVEEASMRAMSLEEAKIRRAELQKARALQSYYEAKAKRERRIKSKKYHKVINKAKRKDFLKQFDEMVKTDPAAALEELRKMERSRMQERMSLKHQNSGKWAKSKAIMAKYDDGARKAMQQQLELNKELTQKVVTSLNEEDDVEERENTEVLPDFVNDAEPVLDPANPWMRGKLSAEPTEMETAGGGEMSIEAGPSLTGSAADKQEDSEQEVEETEEESLLREFDARRKLRQAHESITAPVICVDDDKEATEETEAVAEDVLSDEEGKELSEFSNLYRGIADSNWEAESEQIKVATDDSQAGTSDQLEEGLRRIQNLEDVELLIEEDTAVHPAITTTQQSKATEDMASGTQETDTKKKRKRKIDLKEVLTKEAKIIKIPLAPTDVEDMEEKEEQRDIVKEAFAGDDVISDFLKDKRKQEESGKPKVVDLTLPGWGEWGGLGLKPSRKKRRHFRVKVAPPPERKDRSLPSVIISEKRTSSVSLHQVNSLPFPFVNPMQFESTISTPLGRTWNTEQTMRKITKPKVITQLGAVIEPITREELVKVKK